MVLTAEADPGAVAPSPGGAGGGPVRRALPEAWARRLGVAITVAGLIVATLLALALGTVEVFLAPLRVGGWLVPVSLVLALATNPLLVWFAFAVTGRRAAALLPAGAWCAIWILASARTTEGDLLITSDVWVGLLTLFAGSIELAICVYLSMFRDLRPGPALTGIADGITKGRGTG